MRYRQSCFERCWHDISHYMCLMTVYAIQLYYAVHIKYISQLFPLSSSRNQLQSIRSSNLIQLAITPSAAICRSNAIHSTRPSCQPASSARCLHLIVLVDVESSCCQRMISHSNSIYWLLPRVLISYPTRMITKHGHIPKSWMPHPMLLLSLLNTLTRRSIRDTLAPIMHPPHAQ